MLNNMIREKHKIAARGVGCCPHVHIHGIMETLPYIMSFSGLLEDITFKSLRDALTVYT